MKPNLLLLHGAIGAKQQLQPLADLLQHNCQVHSINFRGHGSNTSEGDFTIAAFAAETAQYIQHHQLAPVFLFGYSMGGYVAMYLAVHQPHLLAGICTLATKFHWDTDTAVREVRMLDAAVIERKLPAFAAVLQERHAGNNWKEVLQKTIELLQEMGRNNPISASDLPAIQTPVLLMLGDRDKMVTPEETIQVYKALPQAQLAILPGTTHPIEQVDIAQLQFQIIRFTRSISSTLAG